MKLVWTSRRTFISALVVCSLTALGLVKGMDVAGSLAAIAIGLSGSNALEGFMAKKVEAAK